jgi:MoxR-like ATPase
MSTRESILDLKARMSGDIIGQEHIVERLLIGLLSNGNLLVEGLPGLAKTRAVKSLAKHLDTGFSRIQFTPDLLPSDITGSEVYYQAEGAGQFRFEPGPIFSNIVLADEINRAPAKVQAALLEAMEERQVTVAKTTHKMADLFMVMATQNPVEQEGTYPLPEAQMDRFLMHVNIEYPAEQHEAEIVRLVRGESRQRSGDEPDTGSATREPVSTEAVFAARAEIDAVHISELAEQYIVDLVTATRDPGRYSEELASWIEVGASPRGTIGLDKCARTQAWLNDRDHVTPDDIRLVIHDVLRHRLMLSYEAQADGVSADQVIDAIVEQVAVA